MYIIIYSLAPFHKILSSKEVSYQQNFDCTHIHGVVTQGPGGGVREGLIRSDRGCEAGPGVRGFLISNLFAANN